MPTTPTDKLVEAAVIETGLPIALHLIMVIPLSCARAASTVASHPSWIDGSHHDYEENVELTKRVVEYAHQRNVTVEAELGRLAGIEDAVNVALRMPP